MTDEESSSPTSIIVYVGLRIYVVVMGLMFLYALSQLVQVVIGRGDIEMVQEVVVVHEYDTEEEAIKARTAQTRGKKQKAQ